MKIGIITFHWGTNYGGVLQAYALQNYLEKNGHEVFIINYKPKRYNNLLIGYFAPKRFIWLLALLKNNFKGRGSVASSFKHIFIEYLDNIIKEKKIKVFRKNYLKETILYESIIELQKNPPKFDVYICGSDQIWNSFFTTKGEGGPTSAYFLDFGDFGIKKIAYAVSFGCEQYPLEAGIIAKEHMKNFSAISVRENSGISIVKDLGFMDPIILPDPTLLLSSSDYFPIYNGVDNASIAGVFSYFLRGENKEIFALESFIKKTYEIYAPDGILKPYSIEEWISGVKNASLVLTNSFHGAVFSIIFHKPFIVLLSSEDTSNMNDRFYTLLRKLNLNDRIITSFDEDITTKLLNTSINWTFVDAEISKLRKLSQSFFNEHLC
ncbi:MAG: hypothetical protein CVT93_08515 [Bacteroidetes bacterium HGW-Bacteroidetes-10]|nr:MAG: hypothetical protein CVT93_08515 [Bacteroidetes bacterium HGW-Bacteroidetes-10]